MTETVQPMEGMELRGSVCRIESCAFDLLAMEEDLVDEDEDAWELMGSDLRLKSTFLYCDLSQVIANANDEHKKILIDLSNRLFCYMEELAHAVKTRSVALTQVCYDDMAHVLHEVMAVLKPPHLAFSASN